MSTSSLFTDLSSNQIAALIRSEKTHVVYAAPGSQDEPATALVDFIP